MVKATHIFDEDIKVIGQHLGIIPPDERLITSLEKAAQFIVDMQGELAALVVLNPEAVAAFAVLKRAVEYRIDNPTSDEAAERFRQAADVFQSAMTRTEAKARAVFTRQA